MDDFITFYLFFSFLSLENQFLYQAAAVEWCRYKTLDETVMLRFPGGDDEAGKSRW